MKKRGLAKQVRKVRVVKREMASRGLGAARQSDELRPDVRGIRHVREPVGRHLVVASLVWVNIITHVNTDRIYDTRTGLLVDGNHAVVGPGADHRCDGVIELRRLGGSGASYLLQDARQENRYGVIGRLPGVNRIEQRVHVACRGRKRVRAGVQQNNVGLISIEPTCDIVGKVARHILGWYYSRGARETI